MTFCVSCVRSSVYIASVYTHQDTFSVIPAPPVPRKSLRITTTVSILKIIKYHATPYNTTQYYSTTQYIVQGNSISYTQMEIGLLLKSNFIDCFDKSLTLFQIMLQPLVCFSQGWPCAKFSHAHLCACCRILTIFSCPSSSRPSLVLIICYAY